MINTTTIIPCSRSHQGNWPLDPVSYNLRGKENRLATSDLSAIAGCFYFFILKTEIKIRVVEHSFVQ